jgi:hypothetical protein
MHGKGIYFWSDGDSWEGEWKNHQRHGKGILITHRGNVYDEVYKDGKRISSVKRSETLETTPLGRYIFEDRCGRKKNFHITY